MHIYGYYLSENSSVTCQGRIKLVFIPGLYRFILIMISNFSGGQNSRSVHQLQRLLVILATYLHLGPFAPSSCQVVHLHVIHLRALLKYEPRVLDLVVGLIELRKLHPQGVQLSYR